MVRVRGEGRAADGLDFAVQKPPLKGRKASLLQTLQSRADPHTGQPAAAPSRP